MEEVKFNFENLKVYEKSLDFIDSIYFKTKRFPKDEKFRLTSQFIRAATSISLNIAEGAGDTNPQFKRFLKIAEGSIKECIVCITIAERQNFITKEETQTLRHELLVMAKMITNLKKYLKTND